VRAKQRERRRRNRDGVVEEREEQVLPNARQRAATHTHKFGKRREPTANQHHGGAFACHLNAAANGNAQAAFGQRRCIVHAIAHHRRGGARLPQLVRLVDGLEVGMHLRGIDANR